MAGHVKFRREKVRRGKFRRGKVRALKIPAGKSPAGKIPFAIFSPPMYPNSFSHQKYIHTRLIQNFYFGLHFFVITFILFEQNVWFYDI